MTPRSPSIGATVAAITGAVLLSAAMPGVRAQSAASEPSKAVEEPMPTFDTAYLNNKENIEAGRNVWDQQCRHCHGSSAYPGKAPKLRPGTYTPEFVFDRVTYGFRGMPPWKGIFTLEERKGVVAYIKSNTFSP
jgi:mono/diheme cytochrome c family protein